MKRAFFLLVISLPLAARCAIGQDAAAIAAQEAADERYKRMAADIQALQLDNESLKAKIASLEQKIDDMRQQQTAASNNSGLQDDLKRLGEKIVEVDQKREADKLAISEEIRKSIGALEKSLAGSGTPPRLAQPKSTPDAAPVASGNDLSYTIKEGDTISVIVKAFNADFKSKGWKTITLKQTMDANPNLDPNRLRIGQKINIPRPEGQ